MQESPKEEIQTYINNFIEKMKSLQNIDNARNGNCYVQSGGGRVFGKVSVKPKK